MLISSSKVKANKYSKLIDTKSIDALLSKKKVLIFVQSNKIRAKLLSSIRLDERVKWIIKRKMFQNIRYSFIKFSLKSDVFIYIFIKIQSCAFI